MFDVSCLTMTVLLALIMYKKNCVIGTHHLSLSIVYHNGFMSHSPAVNSTMISLWVPFIRLYTQVFVTCSHCSGPSAVKVFTIDLSSASRTKYVSCRWNESQDSIWLNRRPTSRRWLCLGSNRLYTR